MTDLVQGLLTGGWGFFVSWVLPSGIDVALFAWLVFPSVAHEPLARQIAGLTFTQRALVGAAIAVGLGLVMNAVSTPLYRLLEGYSWPAPLRRRAVRRHLSRKTALMEKLGGTAGPGWDETLLWERVRRYPADDSEIAPTRLGNALRAFETYARDRFKLDSQLLWTELFGVVPRALREEYDRSHAAVDFFVSTFYLSTVLALGSLAATIGTRSHPWLLALAGVTVLLLPLSYRLATRMSSYWAGVVQAIVNLGRVELAKALGLTMPTTLEAERDMWRRVNRLVFYPYDYQRQPPIDRNFDTYRARSIDG